jgi:MoxR-like ATPase
MWRYDMTKNITLTVEEGLLARFRLLAAQQRTSVNALVRKHMEEATGVLATRENALARLAELSRQSEAYDEAHPVDDEAKAAKFDRETTYSGRRFAQGQN